MISISPQELKARLNDGDVDEILIDVREPNEYKSGRIPEAKNIPLSNIQEAAHKLKGIGTVYVHCGTGVRSADACEALAAEGVKVVNLNGGISAWQQAGFPVVGTGKGVIPIIRQVMIVAGSLVLVGIMLGVFVHPWWYALSAFVGAGLVFAGISGICTMSYLLARMPWNR